MRVIRSDSGRPMCVQVSPPSVDLYTLSPIDAELRVHDSPVPTQIVFPFDGSMAIAPMDCTGCLSNTGLNVVPPSSERHTPPEAAPTNTVVMPSSTRAATAEMRPLIAAEPMLRAPRPDRTPASTVGAFASPAGGRTGAGAPPVAGAARTARPTEVPAAGKWNSPS